MGKSKQISLALATGGMTVGLGTAALFASIIYESSILAFIGLGLAFWGIVFLYVQDREHVPKLVLDASVLPSLSTVDQMIQELGFRGNAVYLPPKYFEDPEATKIYIPKQKYAVLPTPEQIEKYEDQLILENPHGLLLTPPGAELTKLFEKTLETSFNKVDLEYLRKNMPKLFIEDLEIAENLELQTEKDTVHIKMTNSICKEMHKEANRLTVVLNKIGCPICSAIACALTKATGKPVIIENTQISENGKTIETTYQILETAESQEQTEKSAEAQLARTSYGRLSKLATISLISLGSVILSLVGWITYHEATAGGKGLASIFLDPRTGEAISLGMGMRVLYYFAVGLASMLIGILILFRRIRNTKTQPISSIEPMRRE